MKLNRIIKKFTGASICLCLLASNVMSVSASTSDSYFDVVPSSENLYRGYSAKSLTYDGLNIVDSTFVYYSTSYDEHYSRHKANSSSVYLKINHIDNQVPYFLANNGIDVGIYSVADGSRAAFSYYCEQKDYLKADGCHNVINQTYGQTKYKLPETTGTYLIWNTVKENKWNYCALGLRYEGQHIKGLWSSDSSTPNESYQIVNKDLKK